MTYKEKYKELVELLEEVGVLQDDQPWAIQIQEMVEQHEDSRK